MSVICPVTNKECPYLKKLDTDICPREHTCDAVKESYSGMIQKPPAPKKFLITLFSLLLVAIIGISIVYFFVLDGDLSSFGISKKTAETDPTPGPTLSAVPTTEPTDSPAPSMSASHTPLPVTTPVPTELPPIPITSQPAKKLVRIEINGVTAEVKNVSLDENQKIDVLPTALSISWYEGSYLPGTTGNCILFGYKHFDGMAGIFYNLDSLRTGDVISFTLDNGTKIEQKVSDTTIYRDGYLPDDVLELENTTSRTVLISETGDIDPETGGYKDLIVVITE